MLSLNKSIDKLSWLDEMESKTESHIECGIKSFQNLPEKTLEKAPETGGWSIAQCLEHLNTYGVYYIPRLQSGLDNQPHKTDRGTYSRSLLGSYLIRITDPDTSSQKMKALKKHHPAGSIPAHQIVADFIEQQETLLHLLRMARETEINKVKIPLSIASVVKLSVGEILHFMVVHTDRHVRQAQRVQSVSNLH